MKRNMVCIICPKGCRLCVEQRGALVTVTGNTCPRGEQYGESEYLHPVRTLTAAVRVVNRPDTMVSVKTAQPVAKEKMPKVMAALRSTQVNAPLQIGDVILENICGSDIIATKAIL